MGGDDLSAEFPVALDLRLALRLDQGCDENAQATPHMIRMSAIDRMIRTAFNRVLPQKTFIFALATAFAAVTAAAAALETEPFPASGTKPGLTESREVQAAGFSLRGASWIWREASDDFCHLRRSFVLEGKPERATLLITADNGYELYLNGAFVGSDIGAGSDVWASVERYDVTGMMAPGRNVIGILGSDLGGIRGVVAAILIEFPEGPAVELATDSSWRTADEGEPRDYSHPEFVESSHWSFARVVGPMGMPPWGDLEWTAASEARRQQSRIELVDPDETFVWPEEIVYVGEDCSIYVPLQGEAWGVVFRVRDWSRAYTEFDLPSPAKIGRKLYALKPGPGAEPRLILDAGSGALGSPSASFDGRSLFVAMAPAGEKFFHIFQVAADGTEVRRLTSGPFHDIDPAELPDGRIVFTSTRIGTFEEYHGPPSRALFVMNPDGTGISPITFTPIFDNEPKIMADGRIAFVRSDNFFDRAKVETHIHVIRPDGTAGATEAGADVGADYGVRLRVLGYGSPAPLPDGRLAFISNRGNFIASPGDEEANYHRLPDDLGDLAALPDGRLLATVLRRESRQTVSDVIAVIDSKDNRVVPIHQSRSGSVHSPVFLGRVSRPPVIPDSTRLAKGTTQQTGFLFCQDARFTRKTKAGWEDVKAIRVIGAKALTVRSSHSHIVHIGHEAVELGAVPLAPDGSFFVEVPADLPIALQAVDAEGRSELNEMSWIYVRPGERRSCLGCHQPRAAAPAAGLRQGLAMRAPPARLLGQGDPHRFRGNNAGVTGMMDLQFERFREVASLNRHIESAATEDAGREEIGRLKQQLAGRDTSLKISAAQRLGLFRDHAAASALAEALGDSNREVRLSAAMALGSCGTRHSVGPLLNALEDPDALVAQAASTAIENISGHSFSFNAFAPKPERVTAAQRWRAWFEANPWGEIERALILQLAMPASEMASRAYNSSNTSGLNSAVFESTAGGGGQARPIASQRRAVVALGHSGGDAARSALRAFVEQLSRTNPYPQFERDNRTDTFTFAAESPLNPRTLQEAARALGQLRDLDSIPLLAAALGQNIDPRTANLFLGEAAIEALGRMGTKAAEAALIEAFANLKEYWEYVGWYSDHPALYACHSSPIHARIIEALDWAGSTNAASLVPAMIRSVPTDPDRALFPQNDDYERLVGRIIRRNGRGVEVIHTCLALLGDSDAQASEEIQQAISTTHPAWGGHPCPENRAAQILSLVCRERGFEPAVRGAFERYLNRPEELVKRELGNPTWTPIRHWVLFYLARALGNLQDTRSVEALVAVLADELNEARHGRPDPSTAKIHFLHLEYTPCWRAAAAWALGQIGDRRATPALLRAVGNLDNAPDVRHTAATALQKLADPASLAALQELAADYPEVSTRKALLLACEAAVTLR
jgi:HEAT repeat protein